MISSIPRPIAPATERALFQMVCDVGDITAAGWEMSVSPSNSEYLVRIVFRKDANATAWHPIKGYPAACKYFSYPAQRFSLQSELIRIVRDFHRRVIPEPVVDDDSPATAE